VIDGEDMDNVISLKEAVEQRVKETEEKIGGHDNGGPIDSDFIMECLNRNELGDGELFKKLFRKDFVFNKSMGCWMSWAGHHWQIDKMDFASASVESVAKVYQDEARRLSGKINKLLAEEKPVSEFEKIRMALNQRVQALRSLRRRQNCLSFAHTSKDPMAITGLEVDQKPRLFPCSNGVINLNTFELEPGRQEDWMLKASPIEFPKEGINADTSAWEKVLLEIFSGNVNLVDFFRRICGCAILGEIHQAIFIVLSGKGRNGKSMIVETISKILGPLSGAIRSEMLLDQNRIASSSGPTPDIMALRGLRMAFASETDDGCRISTSRVKWLTGNDTITGRNPHDRYEVSFRPSHTLFLLTNHKPHAPADDFAFWERMILFPFELCFVDREPTAENERRSDPQLSKKLESQLPNILAWMVRGCLEWQRDGLARPQVIKDAVDEYQKDEDSVGDFIDECCIIGPKYKVTASDVYTVFDTWWSKNVSNKVPKIKRFGQWFGKRFERVKLGTVWYHGVGLLEDQGQIKSDPP